MAWATHSTRGMDFELRPNPKHCPLVPVVCIDMQSGTILMPTCVALGRYVSTVECVVDGMGLLDQEASWIETGFVVACTLSIPTLQWPAITPTPCLAFE